MTKATRNVKRIIEELDEKIYWAPHVPERPFWKDRLKDIHDRFTYRDFTRDEALILLNALNDEIINILLIQKLAK